MIVRGLRAITDFEYELQMSQTNHKIEPEIETLFLTTSLEFSFLSSTTVKEVASFGGDITQFVPEVIVKKIKEKMEERKRSVNYEQFVLNKLLRKLKNILTVVNFSHYLQQRLL